MTHHRKLSSAFIKNAPVGKHNDGEGLWLHKRKDGGAQWVLRVSLDGERREMGLGGFPFISLTEARRFAAKYRKIAKFGLDPIIYREKSKKDAARELMNEH